MPDSLSSRLRIVQELHEPDPVSAFFFARLLDDDLRELRTEHWPTSERSLAQLGAPLIRSTGHGSEEVVLEREGALVHVSLQGGFVGVRAAAPAEDTAVRTVAWLRDALPTPERVARQEVPVVFWTYSAHGPAPSVRTIAVPEWDEIRDNYAGATQPGLDRIMRDFRPANGGQLVLWHGEVGTGKTFALRALAWEWREWCQIHYVVDPDTFFGEHADYLMSVLMESGGISEHLGMLMAMHGSRGWTGYGPGEASVVSLRPGRCAANIEFDPLSEAEARAWLERRGSAAADNAPRRLASLYAQLEGRDPEEGPRPTTLVE